MGLDGVFDLTVDYESINHVVHIPLVWVRVAHERFLLLFHACVPLQTHESITYAFISKCPAFAF